MPTFAYGGWHDLFASSSAHSFGDIPLLPERKKLIMGDYHFNLGSCLGNPGRPPRLDVLQRARFDKWLEGIGQSGPITVHLNAMYDNFDGYWSVTVNDVAPDGQSTLSRPLG